MSRANNSVWVKLSNSLSEVLSSTLDKAAVESVMTAWESKKKEVTRLVDTTPKKKSDPNAPKRPTTSYIHFCTEQRERVKAKYPTLSATELLKKLSEEWKLVSDKEKKRYEELARKDKERYETEMKSYTPPPETETKKQKSDGPKRPLTAYMYFCQAERDSVKKAHPNMSGKEITTELGARWKALSDSQKAPYEAKQVADKERYETEKGAKTKTSKKDTKSEAKSSSKKTDKPKKDQKEPKKVEKKTEKKTKSDKTPGFEYFLKEQSEELRSENPKLTERQVAAEVGKRWKALSDTERNAYENESQIGSEVELEDE